MHPSFIITPAVRLEFKAKLGLEVLRSMLVNALDEESNLVVYLPGICWKFLILRIHNRIDSDLYQFNQAQQKALVFDHIGHFARILQIFTQVLALSRPKVANPCTVFVHDMRVLYAVALTSRQR